MGLAERVLRRLLVGQAVFIQVVQQQPAPDPEADRRTDEDQRGPSGMVLGESRKVAGLGSRKRLAGKHLDATHQVRLRERNPSGEGLVSPRKGYRRGDGPEHDVALGIADVELKRGTGVGDPKS